MLGWCSVLVVLLATINSLLGRPWGLTVVLSPYIILVCFYVLYYISTAYVQYDRKRRWMEDAYGNETKR